MVNVPVDDRTRVGVHTLGFTHVIRRRQVFILRSATPLHSRVIDISITWKTLQSLKFERMIRFSHENSMRRIRICYGAKITVISFWRMSRLESE
jgi:hypothetical protein